tara:strand:- start:2408 stop:2710 length:303 start_codon:yes stop_codon:yes gene_type:complete
MSSFSKSISLTSINAGSPREAFEGVRNDGPEKSEPCPSSMVEKDKPHPAPHPSPEIAGDVDRAAFDAAWQREQRRAAFIRKRTDPQTGGHVRVLNKTFNR